MPQTVAIVGFGIEGQSALRYWQGLGARVTVCDQDASKVLPEGVRGQLGAHYLHGLGKFDVVVRTSGMHPYTLLRDNPGIEGKMTTVINEFLRACPTKNVIGVTGTKGKGTTSTLITKMLAAAGKQVFLGGNIGLSPLDFLPELTADSWVVLELSSFQLFDVRYSPHIAVCLMVVPEHLNWHADLTDYRRAKSNLFAHQTPHDIAIYFAENETSHGIASVSPGAKIAYFAEPGAYVYQGAIVIDKQKVCGVDELQLLGEHNWQNACAAVTAVWQVTHDVTAMRSVLTTFSGLEHRLEFVREVNDVRYYDDSFGTTPETAMVAIKAFQPPKVVILGGSDKGVSFDELAKTVKAGNVRQVILIGRTAPQIRAALEAQGFAAITPGGSTMDEIMAAAQCAAHPGDVVLLSTACASFDMFRDYKDRGEQFKAAVGAL